MRRHGTRDELNQRGLSTEVQMCVDLQRSKPPSGRLLRCWLRAGLLQNRFGQPVAVRAGPT